MNRDEWPTARDDVRAAWALFKALETDDYDTANDIADAWDAFDLQRGLTLVAAVIRAELRQHAEQVGCACGSDEWLDEHVLHAAATGDDQDGDEGGHDDM